MHYSKSTGGFYDPAIHGENIPADAVDITREQYAALLVAQNSGKVIQPDPDGFPVAVDPAQPTDEQLALSERAKRDALLAASDWVVIRATETGGPVPTEWTAYRHALREVPKQADFPHEIDWPVPPA